MKVIPFEHADIKGEVQFDDKLKVKELTAVRNAAIVINLNGMPEVKFDEYIKQIATRAIKSAPFQYSPTDLDEMEDEMYAKIEDMVATYYPMANFLRRRMKLLLGEKWDQQS